MFNVLVVDDSSMDLILLESIVKDALPFAKNVQTFSDSEQAFLYCQANKQQLVITDIEMPNVDGFELISRLKALDEQTIIAVSGSHAANNANETILYAANCYGADYAVSKNNLYHDLTQLLKRIYHDQLH